MNNTRTETLLILPGWVTKYIISASVKTSADKDRSPPIAEFYEQLVPLLSGYDVRIIALPGFAPEPEPPQPWQIDDYVEFLNHYLDREGIKRVHLLGHSFGGQVAAKFAFRYPGRVGKLILYNAACLREDTAKKRFLRSLGGIGSKLCKHLPLVRQVFYKLTVGSADYARLSGVMRETMANVIREDLGGILPHLAPETLVLWGSADRVTPLRQGLQIKRLLPRAQLIVHPGGHSFHRQDPSTFANHLRNFLSP